MGHLKQVNCEKLAWRKKPCSAVVSLLNICTFLSVFLYVLFSVTLYPELVFKYLDPGWLSLSKMDFNSGNATVENFDSGELINDEFYAT